MTKPQVLIIEDDVWLSEHFARILKSEYRVHVTTNAVEAIDLIDYINPDAIILDILLTGNTAFALLHELQSYKDTGEIPIIVCTSLANELSLNDLGSYGVVKVIDKTKMLPGDLVAALRGVL